MGWNAGRRKPSSRSTSPSAHCHGSSHGNGHGGSQSAKAVAGQGGVAGVGGRCGWAVWVARGWRVAPACGASRCARGGRRGRR
eukprot:scaffold47879_cov27-Phaeocystis_antarctica.AAC.2